MKTNRWILVSPKGEKLKSYQTLESRGLVILNTQTQKLLFSPHLDQEILKKQKHLTVLGTFESGQTTSLNHGYTLKPSYVGEEVLPISGYYEDEEESKKTLLGYLKKSAVIHLVSVVSLILIIFLVQSEEPKIDPPKVTLVEVTPPRPKITQVLPTKPVTQKIVKKVVTTPQPIKKSSIIKTQDRSYEKKPALLQGLQQAHETQIKTAQMIKSFNENSRSQGGGGSLGSASGGTPSFIGNTAMRSSQKGGGLLSSHSSVGYGKYSGGRSTSQGLQIVSHQKGFSLPSSPDDNWNEAGLDRDQIIAVINRHRGEITYCYEQALKKEPSLRGKVSIQFVINPNGRVGKATIAESSATYPPLESCMIARLRSWQFPKPVGAVHVDVLYPFHLTKLGQR